ncbi:hypothetical protein SAMN06298214_1197 [Bacteroidales bacterium WCE2004]|nr:hypothetical protein SAMN06298214_1197 [Bacteroidales bacterium WCE2004]
MKLEKILERLNSLEKGQFLKIINNLSSAEKNNPQLDAILSRADSNLKNADAVQVTQAFNALANRYLEFIMEDYSKVASQLDILLNIITRDGNCIMRLDWFAKLYDDEIKKQKKAIEAFKADVNAEKPTMEESRVRDYKIFAACLKTAYFNDVASNFSPKITPDEQSILDELAKALELSLDERTMIKYAVLGIKKASNIDDVVSELKEKGLIFLSKKNNVIYVADEVVSLARKIRGREVADKYFRRVLLQLKEPQVNMICRKHGIDYKLTLNEKIEQIIASGVSFSDVLRDDIHKADSKMIDKKKAISALCDERLQITPAIKGATLDEKIDNLIAYFAKQYADEKIGISTGGYERLLLDLDQFVKGASKTIRSAYQLQEEEVMHGEFLADFNIMPRDVLELFAPETLVDLCNARQIKTRGNVVDNILAAYKDTEDLLVENYENIGFRNINALKENGISIQEADLGTTFEDVTKYILAQLGLDVDEKLRKKLNTEKDKMDIIIRTGDNSVVLVECKTVKESGYNKFSSISRQVRSYSSLLEKNDFHVDKIIIVAPDFSEDFVADCGDEFTLPITLLKAGSLTAIYHAVKETGSNRFTLQMLSRDILVQEDRIIRALKK